MSALKALDEDADAGALEALEGQLPDDPEELAHMYQVAGLIKFD